MPLTTTLAALPHPWAITGRLELYLQGMPVTLPAVARITGPSGALVTSIDQSLIMIGMDKPLIPRGYGGTAEATRLASEIHDRIGLQRLAAGDFLGRERDLVAWSRRSRGTVREALRLLAEQGLVTTRPGPGGGVFVSTPGPDGVVKSLGILLTSTPVSLAALLEARTEIEAAAVALAATRRTADQVAALAESCDRFGAFVAARDHRREVEENLLFHTTLVEASGNPVLAALHAALHDLVRRSTMEPTYGPEAADGVLAAHRRIAAAVDLGEPAAAVRRLRRHLEAFQAYLRASNQYDLIQRRFRL